MDFIQDSIQQKWLKKADVCGKRERSSGTRVIHFLEVFFDWKVKTSRPVIVLVKQKTCFLNLLEQKTTHIVIWYCYYTIERKINRSTLLVYISNSMIEIVTVPSLYRSNVSTISRTLRTIYSRYRLQIRQRNSRSLPSFIFMSTLHSYSNILHLSSIFFVSKTISNWSFSKASL